MVNSQVKQQGVVLIVALVFLISLTAVASVMMLNSTTDMKISGASEEKLIATQEAISAVDEAIADQVRSNDNLFAKFTYPQEVTSVTTVSVNNVNILNRNVNQIVVDCPHSELASSNELLKCNVLTVVVNNRYGKNNTSNVNVEAGIAQQLLDVGN